MIKGKNKMIDANEKSELTKLSVIDVQRHLEHMNFVFENLLEREISEDEIDLVWKELIARLWAAMYLLQYSYRVDKPSNYGAVLAEADMFNDLTPTGSN